MELTLTQAKLAVQAAIELRRPLFLWGPPGIGKSDLVAQIAKEKNALLIDLRVALMDPTDIRGIPYYNKDLGKMAWAEPVDLPSKEQAEKYPLVFLFLDELNSAPPSVQASTYQLILNRRIGEYHLPDNVVIVAAGNRENDRGVVFKMPTPLANRFTHLDLKHDFESWKKWALDNDVHPLVISYLSFAKQDLFTFDPKNGDKAFATPRTWSAVSGFLRLDLDNKILKALVAGTVGEGLAVSFIAFVKVHDKLPKPIDILTKKVTDADVAEISRQHILTMSIASELKHQSADQTVNLTDYFDNYLDFVMDRFAAELVVMGVRTILKDLALPVDIMKSRNLKVFTHKYGKHVL
jgi:hypothetical protein